MTSHALTLGCVAHVLIYHIGQPRIYMLGGLKVTALVIFGFIVAAVLPTYLEPEVPPWKAPLGEPSMPAPPIPLFHFLPHLH